MLKYYRTVLLLMAVCLIGCASAYASDPSVTLLSFDPSTFTYVYRVVQGLTAADTLTDFKVDAFTQASDPYTMTAPADGSHFHTARTTWSDPVTGGSGIEYQWYGGFVKPGRALTVPWVGDFTLQIQNTMPVPGFAYTYGGQHVVLRHAVNVPGPVPEPSSILALGAMLAGICPAVLRYRKR